MSLNIDKLTLEQACKNIIETILLCLPNAYKGTVYEIGAPPQLVAKRITSGIIDSQRRNISWGLPEKSEYNPPGRVWLDYRDEPGRPLEAMAWCVEKQKSWTSESPEKDIRRTATSDGRGVVDSHHMEPVLIRKEDLFPGEEPSFEYPCNFSGEIIWQDTDYVVVAVIKIHFKANTIKTNSPETKIIRKLSRILGTELLSYRLHEQSIQAMRDLARDKLNSCNILSDSLRNTISKSGLIFSLIKQELGFLREQWESLVLAGVDSGRTKHQVISALNELLASTGNQEDPMGKTLRQAQDRFLELSLPPERGENWVRMQIEERWGQFLASRQLDGRLKEEVAEKILLLKRSLYLGKDPGIVSSFNGIPEEIKMEWVELIYRDIESIDEVFLDRIIHLLGHEELKLPYKEKSRKSLIKLKALAKIIGELEENTNLVLRRVLNGNDKKLLSGKISLNLP